MSIRVLFTADNHIGISYSSFPKAKKQLLEERLESINRMVAYANENNFNYFIIGGDLFEKTNLSKKQIKEVADILKKFTGDQVIIIPGNHDFYETTPESMWNVFRQFSNPEKVQVLSDYEVFEQQCGEDTIHFYPACCRSLHSDENMLGWVKQTEKNNDAINIGIAHGNVTGLGLDDADRYFNMTKEELDACHLDLWLLGHIHVPYPKQEVVTQNPGLFMAGTHMPDSWKNNNYGNAWIIDIATDKKISAQRFRPSNICMIDTEKTINHAADISLLDQYFQSHAKHETALRMVLKGRLDEVEKNELENTIAKHENDFITLEVHNYVTRKIDLALINQTYPNDSLPYTLLTELLDENPEGIAVQQAFEILEALKK